MNPSNNGPPKGPTKEASPEGWRVRVQTMAESIKYSFHQLELLGSSQEPMAVPLSFRINLDFKIRKYLRDILDFIQNDRLVFKSIEKPMGILEGIAPFQRIIEIVKEAPF